MATIPRSAIRIRSLVQRLLGGEREADAVRQILLYLRSDSRSHGSQLIKELGDFAAHFDERDRGLVFQRVVDCALLTEFQLRRSFNPWKAEYPPDRALWQAALPAGLRLLGPTRVHRLTGLQFGKAQKLLANAIPKITGISERGIEHGAEFTKLERHLLERAYRFIMSPEAIKDEDVMRELTEVLVKNGLLLDEEIEDFQNIRDYFAAFLVVLFHQAEIKYDGRADILLTAGIISDQGADATIMVAGTFEIPTDRAPVTIAMVVLSTHLAPREWCDESLPTEEYALQSGLGWRVPIELAPDGRLRDSTR